MKKFLFAMIALSISLFAQTRIAAVGNSITAGLGIPNPSTDGYPAVLQNLMGSAFKVSNFGHSSATMLKNGNLPYWNQSAFSNAKSFLPHIVVIELGTNDAKSYNWYARPTEFPQDYKNMIEEFQSLSSTPDVWICLAPFSNNPPWQINDTTLTKRINPDILEVGIDKGVHVIDLHSTLSDHSGFQADSVHPNAKGAAQIAAIVRNHLLRDTLVIQQLNTTLYAPEGHGFQWYKDGVSIAGATQQTLKISEIGDYKVSVKVEASIDSRIVSQTLKVTDLTSGIPPYSSATEISSSSITTKLAPATANSPEIQFLNNTIHVRLPIAGFVQIAIYDIQGHRQSQINTYGKMGSNQFPLPLTKGAHILKIRLQDQTISHLWIRK